MIFYKRYIAHVDMDAFFASCEQHDNPAFRGKPVIVGADPKGGTGRGVVAACSYEARKFGVHSALPISAAYYRCPQGIFLRPNMERYVDFSHQIFDILQDFTPDVEPISIDEAFIDITGSWQHFGRGPIDTCRKIKLAIKERTGLTASIGLAPNKMTAKIASDINKPDGLVVVNEKNLLQFLHPLPVGRLWTIGKKTEKELHSLGIKTIGQLASFPLEKIEEVFGKNGTHAWELANGIDNRPVETFDEVKSVSNEYTFSKDTNDINRIKDVLMYLSEKVSRRMRQDDLKGRTITLKVRFRDFKTFTRSITIESPTNFVDRIYTETLKKLTEFNLKKDAIRLVGVKVSNLVETSEQVDLFELVSSKDIKKENLHKALDRIAEKFGEDAVSRRST